MLTKIFIIIMFYFCVISYGAVGKDIMSSADMVENIKWYGQSGIKITIDTLTIYIDPYQINATDPADIIFITHSHADHFSPTDINKILKKNTILVGPETCKDQMQEIEVSEMIFLNPGEDREISGIKCQAIPAYNIKKTDFHPKENKWLGYILTIKGVKIYHAGDTERIPEMKDYECDIALLPLGQTYTMNSVEEAVQSALDIKATIAIPMHYGLYEGSLEDAQKFNNLLEGKIQVMLLKMSK